jgi:hypothetical protein
MASYEAQATMLEERLLDSEPDPVGPAGPADIAASSDDETMHDMERLTTMDRSEAEHLDTAPAGAKLERTACFRWAFGTLRLLEKAALIGVAVALLVYNRHYNQDRGLGYFRDDDAGTITARVRQATSEGEFASVVDPTGAFRGCHLRLRAWLSDVNITFNATLSAELSTLTLMQQAGYDTGIDDPGQWSEKRAEGTFGGLCFSSPASSLYVSCFLLGASALSPVLSTLGFVYHAQRPTWRLLIRGLGGHWLASYTAETLAGLLTLVALPLVQFEDRMGNRFTMGVLIPSFLPVIGICVAGLARGLSFCCGKAESKERPDEVHRTWTKFDWASGYVSEIIVTLTAIYTVLAFAYYNGNDIDLTRANRVIALSASLFQIALAFAKRMLFRSHTIVDEHLATRKANLAIDRRIQRLAARLLAMGCGACAQRLKGELELDETTLNARKYR